MYSDYKMFLIARNLRVKKEMLTLAPFFGRNPGQFLYVLPESPQSWTHTSAFIYLYMARGLLVPGKVPTLCLVL